jgi:hypothetical protein
VAAFVAGQKILCPLFFFFHLRSSERERSARLGTNNWYQSLVCRGPISIAVELRHGRKRKEGCPVSCVTGGKEVMAKVRRPLP